MRERKRKILAAVLLTLALCFAGCDGKQSANAKTNGDSKANESVSVSTASNEETSVSTTQEEAIKESVAATPTPEPDSAAAEYDDFFR